MSGNRVYVISVPWVQIPFSAPYVNNTNSQWESVLFFYRRLCRMAEKNEDFILLYSGSRQSLTKKTQALSQPNTSYQRAVADIRFLIPKNAVLLQL